jgi:hypothetical protein
VNILCSTGFAKCHGISSQRSQSIPWSVIDNEGAVQGDKNVVLGKQLFSIDKITRPPVSDNDTFANQPDVTELNEPISRPSVFLRNCSVFLLSIYVYIFDYVCQRISFRNNSFL